MQKQILIFCLWLVPFSLMAAGPDACMRAHAQIQKGKTSSYVAVEQACNALVEPLCQANTDKIPELGGGDAQLVNMACALRTAYVGNQKVGQAGHATPACEKAIIHLYTPLTQVAADKAALCLSETEKVCAQKTTEFEKSLCRAEAAFASYGEARWGQFKLDPEMQAAAEKSADDEGAEYLKQLTQH